MRQALVIGNWKMNGTLASVKQWMTAFAGELEQLKRTKVAICPPFVYLSEASEMLAETSLVLGAQDVCGQGVNTGAYTGDVSATMLSDLGCRYVIIGHSERRQYYQESGSVLSNKICCAQQCGLIPVFCIGESLEQREAGLAEQVVIQQIEEIVNALGIVAFKQMVVAYEPVWAIGTGKTATPDIAQAMHVLIREKLAKYDSQVADNIQLLYGGSVKTDNAAALFRMQDIDGALVGGACLEADSFSLICQAAESL